MEYPFGKILAGLRDHAGLTLLEVATAAGISHTHLLRAEMGERKLSDDTVQKVLVFLLKGVEAKKQRSREEAQEKIQREMKEIERKLAVLKEQKRSIDRELARWRRKTRASLKEAARSGQINTSTLSASSAVIEKAINPSA